MIVVIKNQLQWAGRLVQMTKVRMPKQIFYSPKQQGKRKRTGQKKCFKDTLKQKLMKHQLGQLERGSHGKTKLEDIPNQGINRFEKLKTKHLKEKWEQRKQPMLIDPDVHRPPVQTVEESEHMDFSVTEGSTINKRRSSSLMCDSHDHWKMAPTAHTWPTPKKNGTNSISWRLSYSIDTTLVW